MDIKYFFDFFTLALIALLGAMSPGPDFTIVTRYALTGSRKAALLASFGIVTALLVHISYCSLGVAVLLIETPWLFRLIQMAGSFYLAYLGISLLMHSYKAADQAEPPSKQAFLTGFLCNLLNPKCTLFLFGVYTQFVDPNTPLYVLIIYGLIIIGTSLAWFCTLTYLITHSAFKNRFALWRDKLTKGMGILLLIVAVTVLYQTLNT